MKIIKKVVKLISNISLFFISSLAIFVAGYQFGWMLLVGGLGWGNDLPFALSLVYYLDRWTPYLPRWHYEWAGGFPFLKSYPGLITYLTNFTHQLTDLTIVQTTRLLIWLSIPLAGVGIVLLARLLFKNWLLATLAGLFFILSPDAWLWIMFGGFYAAAASFPFMVIAFVFFELGWQKKKRIWWLLAIVFTGLTWLTHPITGASLTIGLGVYGLCQGLAQKKVLSGLARSILVSGLGVLLIAFWIIPFVTSRPAGVGVAPGQVVYVTVREILGLATSSDYITSVFFTGAVWALALLGVFFALVRRSLKAWTAIACAFVGLFFMVGPGIFPGMLKGPILTLWSLINVRGVVLPRLFVPIIAAYGAISLGEAPFRLLAWVWKKLQKSFLWQAITQLVGGGIALVVVYFAFKQIVILPGNHPSGYLYPGYGPVYHWLDAREVNGRWMIHSGKNPVFPSVEESIRRLLTLDIQLDDAPVREAAYFPGLIKKLGLDSHDRIDISFLLAGSVVASWSTASGVPLTSPYLGAEATLMRTMIGYQQVCFHNFSEEFKCLKDEIRSLAKWWGLKWVYIGEAIMAGEKLRLVDEEPLGGLKLAEFEEKIITTDKGPNFLLYQIPETTEMATLTNKPLVLVIGENPPYNDGFSNVFRSFNRSGFNYDKALPIQGKRFIDDYTLKDLKKYPLIVLYGYQTHNKSKAWSMLSQYVKNGGHLFVDTGWQFWSEDWGKKDKEGQSLAVDLADFLPVSKIKWGNVGTGWRNLKLNSSFLGKRLSNQDWGDLDWEGSPWGMSLAEPQDLKEFAQPLVTVADKVIVAGGNFGQGKIVWSGMNLFGHISYYESESENEFLGAVFSWLTTSEQSQEKDLDFERITPDKIVININKTLGGKRKIMFKEAMGPGWKAYLTSNQEEKKLPILKAGPGWKLVLLPEDFSIGQLTLIYHLSTKERLGIFISVLTALGMIIYLLDGIFKGAILSKLVFIDKTKSFFKNKIDSLKRNWEDEES